MSDITVAELVGVLKERLAKVQEVVDAIDSEVKGQSPVGGLLAFIQNPGAERVQADFDRHVDGGAALDGQGDD